jgi:hypothetical protein
MEAEQKLRDSRQKPYKGRENPESPWYGSHQFTPKRWRRDIADALLNQLYPSRPIPKTIGFKEIRWYSFVKPEQFDETLDWLCSLHAPGAIIFLFRDLDNVMKSGWWAEMEPEKKARDRAKLERFEVHARAYAETHPDSSIVVTYEDFISTAAAPQAICDLLGVGFKESVSSTCTERSLSSFRARTQLGQLARNRRCAGRVSQPQRIDCDRRTRSSIDNSQYKRRSCWQCFGNSASRCCHQIRKRWVVIIDIHRQRRTSS